MKKTTRKRGRPRKPGAKSAAERMRAYRKRKRDLGFRSVRRWEPVAGEGASGYSDHRILDARSLAMHCRIAQKISRNPGLLDKARDNVARWVARTEGEKPRYLEEWEQILEQPWPAIADLITSMSEEATRLRSSSPFAGVLTEDERNEVYAAFRS